MPLLPTRKSDRPVPGDRRRDEHGAAHEPGAPRKRATPPSPLTPRLRPGIIDDPLAAERRLRAAGGPEDRETHACECGCVFEAAVATDVRCPRCDRKQAW